jgi:catechol 2,3-dioxygenase-like lactoylglutathione lyase family enzyme
MKWVIVLLAAAMCGCAKNSSVIVDQAPAKAAPLASYVQIAISLREDMGGLAAVRPFYEKLGFVAIEEGGEPVPYVVYTDGMIHLRVDECQFPSPRLDYYTSDAPKQVQRLESLDIMYSTEKACARKVNVTNFVDPNGQQLGLIQRDHAPVAEPRKSQSLMGSVGELSIHTANRDESIAWYERLGFKTYFKFDKPHHWAILSDGNMVIGLHQSNDFTKTTITYFSKDSADRIEKLKSMGFKFTNEQKNAAGKVANGMLTAPDGQTFFVFQQ